MSFLLMTFSQGSTPIEEQQRFWKEITPKITMWASDELFAQWSNFKYELGQFSPPEESRSSSPELIARTVELSKKAENLFLLIRKDLGYENKSIKEFDVISLFVNDIYKHVERPKKPN